MNHSKAIFLINKDVRAVKLSYELTADGKPAKLYTYKTMDPDMKPEDLVVIPTSTRHGMTVGRIEEVDVELDVDDDVQLKWIIGAVDAQPYYTLINQEKQAIDRIKSAEKGRMRKQLADDLLQDLSEADRKALPFYNPE